MKKLFFLLALVLSIDVSQAQTLTGEMIGIPEEMFTDLQNVVFVNKYAGPGIKITSRTTTTTVNGVRKSTRTTVAQLKGESTVKSSEGIYALNLADYFLHSYGYNDISQSDSGWTLTASNGSMAIFWHAPNSPNWFFRQTNAGGPIVRQFYEGVPREFNAADILKMPIYTKGWKLVPTFTVNDIEKFTGYYREGFVRDPAKYVTSIFAIVSRTSADVYSSSIYVSGFNVDSIDESKLITSFGKTGMTFTTRWKFYNDCERNPAVDQNGVLQIGNFGNCMYIQPGAKTIQVQPSDHFEYIAETNTVLYDASKPHAMLELDIESFQAQGKNEGDQGYWNMKTGSRAQNL